MPGEYLNTREVAEYLNIHEKQVYALIKEKKIPCTRVTGKWIFPKRLIDEWIQTSSTEGFEQLRERAGKSEGVLLAAGSNDPVLDILLNNMKQTHPGFYIFSSSTGSTDGLRLLGEGWTDIAWCHLYDPKTGEYNLPYINTYVRDRKVAVVHLFYRELGFLSSPGLHRPVRDFADLSGEGIMFINRQKGSGTRVLLDCRLEERGIDPLSIRGYDREVYTHFEVGLDILAGESNTGIATVAVSKLFGLPFEPIVRESFDMVLAQETFFDKRVQGFIDTLKSPEFRAKVEPLGNYDFSESGRIIYSTT